MRKLALAGFWLILMLRAALAGDPQGEWLDEHGLARIKVADCNGHIWGAIAWEKEPGGVDDHNPDVAKRSRPTLGVPILLDMKPAQGTADKWEGNIYNPENGKTYSAHIQLTTPTKLEVKGCVLKYLCGGETWTRYVEPAPAPGTMAPKAAPAKQPAPAGAKAAAKGGVAVAPANPNAEFCAAVQAAK